MKIFCSYLLFILFSIPFSLSWNIGGDKKLTLKLKSKLGLCRVVLTTPKTSPEKLTLTVVEMQFLPDTKKTDSKKENSCLKWTLYIGSKKYV